MLYFIVIGVCMESELLESYIFECLVCGLVIKIIFFVNVIMVLWCLYLKIMYKYFIGSSVMVVLLGEIVEYEVYYKFMKMIGLLNEF